MRSFLCLFLWALCVTVSAQTGRTSANLVDATIGLGGSRGTASLSWLHNWRLGTRQKIGIGLGGRFTSFLGLDLNYITAPAKLTSGSTGPLVIFKENIAANIDTLLLNQSQVNALNLMINIDCRISAKIIVGFNIDAIGFSFGRVQRGNYISGLTGKNTNSKPTFLNVLLISDNDLGSLNSELYARYFVTDRFAMKLCAQFLFTEYTTDSKVQQQPEANDRFRNKSLMAAIGASYKIKYP